MKLYLPAAHAGPVLRGGRGLRGAGDADRGDDRRLRPRARGRQPGRGWYDVSTLKEPYRIEGKKTMAYEIVEQMDGRVPDVLIYPTGGGTGLIGMWKAFAEMERLGWIGSKRPRMVACRPRGARRSCARGRRGGERGALGGRRDLRLGPARPVGARGLPDPEGAARERRDGALAVTDEEMREAVLEMGRAEGIHAAPEGGATLAALHKLGRATVRSRRAKRSSSSTPARV